MGSEAVTGASLPPVVAIRDLVFGWENTSVLLDIPAMDIAAGEKVFLRGPSGSGKSSLLGLICGVLTARSGAVRILDCDLTDMPGARRDALRAAHLGVIFQMFNLLPFLSVIDNVVLPCRFSRERLRRAGARGLETEARRLLGRLGLSKDSINRTSVRELSVGQQQRVAAARALIGGPSLIVADEPTSALDSDARDAFIDLLIEESAAHGSSLLFVSHDRGLSDHFDRALDLPALNRAAPTGGGEAVP